MPTPKPGESRDDFVSRCVPIVIEDETADDSDQAVAICNSMWEQEQEKSKGKTMERKTFHGFVTKVDEEQGIIEAFFAIFGNMDHGGDVMHPGAFSKTFAERGGKVKVLDNHRTDSIMRAIGKPPLMLKEVRREELPPELLARHPETTGGAFARIQMLMTTPEGKGAFIRLKAGAVDEWSFGYDAVDTDMSRVVKDGDEMTVRNLRAVKLYEISPVLFGMNEATVTVSAKMESKPEAEVTENTIRIRVRDPNDFQEDSFKTIDIDEEQGIQAVIGRLIGETTTTIQTYIFDKEKWTVSRAQAWVEEHEKASTISFARHVDTGEIMLIWKDDSGKHHKFKENELKEGRVISKATGKRIKGAMDGIQKMLGDLENMLETAGITADVPPVHEDEEKEEKQFSIGDGRYIVIFPEHTSMGEMALTIKRLHDWLEDDRKFIPCDIDLKFIKVENQDGHEAGPDSEPPTSTEAGPDDIPSTSRLLDELEMLKLETWRLDYE